MAVFPPSLVVTGQALIDALAADIDLGNADSHILSVLTQDYLSAYPIDVPTTASERDTGELERIKYGGRLTIPDGLSWCFVPMPFEPAWDSAPRGMRVEYRFQVELYWKNPPDLELTASPGVLHRLLSDISEATMLIIGPEGLMNEGGGWDVTGDGDYLLDPFIALTVPSGQIPNEKRHEEVYYSLMTWGAEKYWSI